MEMLLRRRRRRPCLIVLAGLSAFALAAAPAAAQQVTAAKGSVTIDLGVLNQLGTPSTPGGYYPYSQAPGYAPAYGQSAYGQPAYAQPAYSGYSPYPTQSTGSLLYPPTQNPVSTLTVPPPPGSTPYVPEQAAAAAPTANVASSPPPPPSTPATPAEATNQGSTTAPVASTDTTASTAGTTTGQSTTGATTAATGTTASTDTGSTATATGTSAAPAAPATPAVPAATVQSGTAAGGQTTTAAATGSTGNASTATAATTTGRTTTASTGGQAAEVPPAEGQLQIAFPKDSADIPDAAKSELDSLAQKMVANDAMRLQLLAYASGTPDTASRARRMSLSRALAVRSYLIKKGVVSTRMDVRALGSNVQGEPADRVDILPKAS
jgi:outer membrane protein OmpA-like peptidoglycan-associated protein